MVLVPDKSLRVGTERSQTAWSMRICCQQPRHGRILRLNRQALMVWRAMAQGHDRVCLCPCPLLLGLQELNWLDWEIEPVILQMRNARCCT